MKLELVRSGGFAGIEMRSELDTSELPADQAGAVQQALEALAGGPEATSAPPGRRPGGADRFQYDLTVVDDGRRRHYTFHDGSVPAALQPVIRLLTSRAAPG
jgi:emfourin